MAYIETIHEPEAASPGFRVASCLHDHHPRGATEMKTHARGADAVGRREFLALGGAGRALAALPVAAHGQAKRSGEIAAGLSERMRTLDAANRYPISATSALPHVLHPLVGAT